MMVMLFAAYDARWRRIVAGCAVVAVGTYLIEYGLFPSHGMYLVHLTGGAEPVVAWGRSLSSQTGQTLVRMPLFAAYLTLLGSGLGLLRRRLAGVTRLV